LQRKLAGLLNTHGYYDHLLTFIEHSIQEGFLKQQHRDSLLVETDGRLLLDRLVLGANA